MTSHLLIALVMSWEYEYGGRPSSLTSQQVNNRAGACVQAAYIFLGCTRESQSMEVRLWPRPSDMLCRWGVRGVTRNQAHNRTDKGRKEGNGATNQTRANACDARRPSPALPCVSARHRACAGLPVCRCLRACISKAPAQVSLMCACLCAVYRDVKFVLWYNLPGPVRPCAACGACVRSVDCDTCVLESL